MPNQESKKSYEFFAPKVFIRTFGCQMNVRDSEVIEGLLANNGYRLTDSDKEADIIIFNTCSVRQHAEDKVWSEIGRLKNGKNIIGVVGCMAQNYKQDIFTKAANVDFVVGPSDIHRIPEIIKKVTSHKSQVTSKDLLELRIWETDGNLRPEEIYHTGFHTDKKHAYVVISEGCSNYCSYCVVPYVRGELRSRAPDEIVREIKEAVAQGISAITLLGQNVNAYEYAGVNFVNLLESVNLVKGLKEFSFITSHPKDTTSDLFKVMADSEKLKKYLHLPVQSGSDRILKLMNRGYTKTFYLELINNYRKIVKGGILTTDIIVGFPGETESDFQDTRSLIEEVQFEAGYIFKYSPRPHTEAAKLDDNVPLAQKQKRHSEILELQKKISKSKNER